VLPQRKIDPSLPDGRISKAVRSTMTAPGKYPAAASQARRLMTSANGSWRFLVYIRPVTCRIFLASSSRRIARDVAALVKKTSDWPSSENVVVVEDISDRCVEILSLRAFE